MRRGWCKRQPWDPASCRSSRGLCGGGPKVVLAGSGFLRLYTSPPRSGDGDKYIIVLGWGSCCGCREGEGSESAMQELVREHGY